MATITWPTTIKVGACDYAVEFDVQINVARNGRIQTYGLPGARWVARVRFENDREDRSRPAVEAFLMSLRGGANRVSMPHFGRPRPHGTLTGTPTVGGGLAAGSNTITIVNANGTLKKGDIIGVPGQFVMVVADATPLAGVLTVNVEPTIRASHNSGTAITWNRPHALWIPKSNTVGPFPYMAAKFRPAFQVEFVEAWL